MVFNHFIILNALLTIGRNSKPGIISFFFIRIMMSGNIIILPSFVDFQILAFLKIDYIHPDIVIWRFIETFHKQVGKPFCAEY